MTVVQLCIHRGRSRAAGRRRRQLSLWACGEAQCVRSKGGACSASLGKVRPSGPNVEWVVSVSEKCVLLKDVRSPLSERSNTSGAFRRKP
jgi:hypothetical protein